MHGEQGALWSQAMFFIQHVTQTAYRFFNWLKGLCWEEGKETGRGTLASVTLGAAGIANRGAMTEREGLRLLERTIDETERSRKVD